MADNNRIFYACQAVSICKTGHPPSAGAGAEVDFCKGVQSAGITTNFQLSQIFEFGQIEIYANLEEIAEAEVTVEKVIDGEKLLYLDAVGEIGKTDIAGAANSECDVYLAIFDDAVNSSSATTPKHVVYCSGMVMSNVSYSYSVDGEATESISLTGSDKFWDKNTYGVLGTHPSGLWGTDTATGLDNTDTPTSGIVRRAQVDIANCTIPGDIPNVGDNKGRIQSISISADFGREDAFEIGSFGPYFKVSTFPFEVTTEIEVLSARGDQIAISGNAENLQNRTVIIQDTAGTVLNTGTNNKLSSVNYGGGDTGGGNATATYSYSTFNSLTVNGGGTYWT
jgi:hypothetical protein